MWAIYGFLLLFATANVSAVLHALPVTSIKRQSRSNLVVKNAAFGGISSSLSHSLSVNNVYATFNVPLVSANSPGQHGPSGATIFVGIDQFLTLGVTMYSDGSVVNYVPSYFIDSPTANGLTLMPLDLQVESGNKINANISLVNSTAATVTMINLSTDKTVQKDVSLEAGAEDNDGSGHTPAGTAVNPDDTTFPEKTYQFGVGNFSTLGATVMPVFKPIHFTACYAYDSSNATAYAGTNSGTTYQFTNNQHVVHTNTSMIGPNSFTISYV